MKYQLSPPSEVTVEMKQILNIIDLFDLDQLQRLLNHKNIFQKNQYLQQYLLNKIDYELENIVTEIQKNPVYDCTQLLKSIYDLMMITEIYWNGFLSYDHVINIIQYTDKLIVQDYCFSILINIHDSQFYEKNSKRIKQLIIIFQEHVNYLSSQKIELFDFYIQDPIKISFDIEYLEPTELDKSYEDLQKDEQNPTIISNQFKLRKILIEDDNQISALDSSRKLLNIQNQHFTPLLDIVKQRIIIKRGLQNNPQETKKIVILLHFKSIKLSKILNKFYEVNMYPFENYLKLFHKKIIDPSILIMLIDELKEKSDLDCFNNSEEIIKQLLQDVLSMKHKKQIQQYQGYPLEYNNLQIIDNICVKNESIVFGIFELIQSNACSKFLRNDSFFVFAIQYLKQTIIFQDNKLMLPPKQLIRAIQLITSLLIKNQTQKQDFEDDLNIFYPYIKQNFNLEKPTDNGYEKIEEIELDLIISTSIQSINQFFLQIKDDEFRNCFINKLQTQILEEIDKILIQSQKLRYTIKSSLEIISNISNNQNDQIPKLLNSNLPFTLNQMILEMNTKGLIPINMVMNFYSSISIIDNVYYQFNDSVNSFIEHQLIFLLTENDDQQAFYDLILLIDGYAKKIEKSRFQLSLVIIRVFDQILQQIQNSVQNLNFDQDFKIQYQRILRYKKFVIKSILLIEDQQLIQYLQENGIQEKIKQFNQIPYFQDMQKYQSFQQKSLLLSDQNNINKNEIMNQVLRIIEQWESELGYPLNQAQELADYKYFKKKSFFQINSYKDFEIAKRFAQIFSLIYSFNQSDEVCLSQQFLLNCCNLLELLFITENKSQYQQQKEFTLKQHSKLLMFAIINHIKQQFQESQNLEILQLIITKLFYQSQQSPRILLLVLQKIKLFLKLIISYQIVYKFLNFIFQTQFYDYLQSTLQYYISQICDNNLEQTQIMVINNKFCCLLQLITEINSKISIYNKQALPQLIQNILDLFKITFSTQHKSFQEIQKQLLQLSNSIINPRIIRQPMELKEFANLKYYLRLNFLYLPYSNLNIFERFKFSKSELFQILCLIVKEEFQIQLKFQGIEQEIVIPTQNRLNALVQMLMEINKSVYFAEEENQIVQQLLKLLIPLLYLNDELAIQAVNQILLIIQKIQINNERILDSTFILIIKLLDSQFFASSTSNNCIEILIKIFQVNRSFVHKFIYQMKGLEKLLKLEGSNQDQYRCLSKLVISIIYDKTLIRASIEAKIKKSIFDQENNKEIEKSNIELSKQQYYNQNTYPVCIQPVQYNVKINDQLKLSENHPTLQALKNGFFKKDVKYVMNSLFEDSQDGYLILKKGIQLDELNSIYKNNDSIQQFNFVHTQKTQTILSLLVQQLITSYFETKKQYQYDQKIIFSVLQLLILRFPLLISQIVRINCSKFLQKYKNEIGFISQDLPDKISFLSLITKYIIPPNDFIFDLCLDNIVLFKTSNNVIVPFANEIRKIIIKELHYEISQSIKNFDKKIYQYSNILLCLLQINSVAKICFQNIKEPDNSFNFIKIYKEGIKNFDILQINIFKTQLIQIIKTLRILYNLASYLILEMTMPFVLQQQDSQTQVQSISMSNLERNYQLIFINKNQNIWIKDSQIDEEVQIDQQQQILENNNIQQIYDKIDQQQLIWINNYEEGEQNEEDEQNQEYEEDEEYEEYEVYEEYEEDENLHQSETLDTDFLDCIFRPYFIQNFDQHIQYKVQLDKFIKIQDDIKNQNQVDQVQKFKKKIQQLLGIIDQQLIKQLQRLILLNYPNPNLILSEVKAFFAYFAVYQNYEIINPLIQQLKEVNQQEMSINYLQSNFIIEDYQLKKDKKYVSQFVSKIILELIYKFCEKKKCQLSQTNVNELIKFLQLFSENDHLIQLLLLVLNLATFDQVQKIQSISFEQIKLLLTLLISGKFKDKKNLKGVISKLYYNYDNQKKIKAYIYNFLEKQQQYFENCFQKQEVEIKNLFKGYQLLEIFKLIKFIYNQNSNFNIAKDIQEQQLTKLCENLQFFILDMQPQNKQLYLETIMPYLKCVLKIHQILYPKQEQIQSNIQISQISNQSSSSENNIEKIFKNLCDKGKNFINYMLQRELQNYNNKRIKKFVKDFITYYPKIIDISIKQLYLQNIIKELNGFNRNTHQFQKTILIIDRQNIFLDSYEKISQLTDFDLKNEFQIEFLNEPGIDAGGLLKEWFSKLSQEILNPRNQLFTKTINSRKYKIYRLSSNDPDHLQKFEFVGKIYAKAILQGQLIQGKIVKSFFKHILGRNLTINDFKSIDKTKYLTLTKILNEKFSCDLEWEYQVHNCVECEDEDYCINTEILELIPGGRNISVTEENKKQYIRELCYSILAKNIEDQIKAFQKGFFSLIPQKYIKIFDQNQIEQLLCGKTEIEIEDLIKNLKFKDYDVNNQVIQWLFNVLKSFSNDMLSKFLWFVAGSGLVPIGGFINLPKPIIIKKFTTNNDDQSLPISHTCTLTMELPEYSSEQILKDKLELAILEGHQTYQME